ncbi:MAG TPA: methyltransferase domain-containing protein [Nitrospira sp.]|nr:methyltransferase domain-containing protein [Nitrospira sp.]
MQRILDIGCGPAKMPGTIGVDRRRISGVDVVCDIEQELPFKTSAVDRIWMRHVMEHVRDLVRFMEEIYRISRDGAAIEVVVPYYTSRGAFRDPTHVRYITEDTFQYFEPPTDYGIKTDFRIERIHYDMRKPFRWFPRYLQKRCRRYLWNVVDNMEVTLRVVKNGTVPGNDPHP